MKPLAIDLFCGLGGWAEGLLAEGWDVIGFDIERHVYGVHRYPAQLVIQNILTLHGSQLRSAKLIVASPPCQKYSYMAMPWSRAKEEAAAIRADETGAALEDLNRLFNACFRIQREACEAAGRHIQLVVENVRGAQPWVGRARWSYGSFFLWGDVPALMPITLKGSKVPGFRFDGSGKSFQSAAVEQSRTKLSMPADDSLRIGFQQNAKLRLKESGFKTSVTNPAEHEWNYDEKSDSLRPFSGLASISKAKAAAFEETGIKSGGDWFNDKQPSISRQTSSKSPARKFASAMIAKIPLPLSSHIARVFYPERALEAAE